MVLHHSCHTCTSLASASVKKGKASDFSMSSPEQGSIDAQMKLRRDKQALVSPDRKHKKHHMFTITVRTHRIKGSLRQLFHLTLKQQARRKTPEKNEAQSQNNVLGYMRSQRRGVTLDASSRRSI